MKAADFLGKATRAAVSVRLLLNADDIDGACNRAYYAMFDAAQAALLISAGDASAQLKLFNEIGRSEKPLMRHSWLLWGAIGLFAVSLFAFGVGAWQAVIRFR